MPSSKSILVTGGTGYIGSHTVVELLQAGWEVVILDNFSNSSAKVLARIEAIASKPTTVKQGDIRNPQALEDLFVKYQFSAVIHFAGLKAVGESVAKPLLYFQNNVSGSLELIQVMSKYNCKRLVYSSSATVYGDPSSVPIDEQFPLSATNPYGQSKLMVENILRDVHTADPEWQISVLRYFNPVAAHPSGLIGEDPNGVPNNLMPYIAQVAVGRREELTVHGNDYATADGTGVRDYIHVVDLARAHLAALGCLDAGHGWRAYNIGTGRGYSVLEMVHAFGKASGRNIPYKIGPRRDGDVASCYANVDLANNVLNWRSTAQLDEIMQDQWRWQSENPDGYTG